MAAHLLRPGALAVLARALRRQHRQSPGQPGVGRAVSALPRMLAASLSGRYRGLPVSRALGMAAAAAYVVSPLDLVPEVLVPLGGLVDDTLVLAWLSGAVLAETQAFLAWEAGRAAGGEQGGDVVPGEVLG